MSMPNEKMSTWLVYTCVGGGAVTVSKGVWLAHLPPLVFEDLRGNEPWCTYEPPGSLSGGKLTDAIVRELDKHCLLSELLTRGWFGNGIQGVWESPHKNVVTLEVPIDDAPGVKVLDGCGQLPARGGVVIHRDKCQHVSCSVPVR